MEFHPTNTPDHRQFTVGGVTIDPSLNRIQRGDRSIQVERQVMLLLLFLIEHVDQVVAREKLHFALWPDSIPNEEALTQAISKLRKALGDRPRDGRMIQTIRKVGYRLIGPVSYPDQPISGSRERPARGNKKRSAEKKGRWSWVALALFLVATTISAAALVSDQPNGFSNVRMVRMVISSNNDAPSPRYSLMSQAEDSTQAQNPLNPLTPKP